MKINTPRLVARIRAMALLSAAALSGYLAVTAISMAEFFIMSSLMVLLVFRAIVDAAMDTRFEKNWKW